MSTMNKDAKLLRDRYGIAYTVALALVRRLGVDAALGHLAARYPAHYQHGDPMNTDTALTLAQAKQVLAHDDRFPAPARWYEDVENVIRLAEWLDASDAFDTPRAAIYVFEKPWKWTEEWAWMRAKTYHANPNHGRLPNQCEGWYDDKPGGAYADYLEEAERAANAADEENA